jgi:hypothetical protein
VGKSWRRALIAAGAVAALIAATSSTAKAALSLGFIDQFGPPPPALCINPTPQDLVQATGPAAPSYTVPAAPGQSLVVTSWSHNAAAGSAPIGFKVYRPVSGNTYRVVGHDGPRPLTSGINTFSGLHIPVLPGDVIGLHTAGASTACHFNAPGQSYLFRTGDLADGQEGAFGQNTGEQLNVSALVEPDNRLSVQEIRRNKKRGTARITLDTPNPGVIHLGGKGAAIRGTRSRPVESGPFSFVLGALGFAREKLLARGKVRVIAQISYIPTGGAGSFLPVKLTLRKRLR